MIEKTDSAPERRDALHRRTVLKGAAWSLPVIAAAASVPMAAATGAPLGYIDVAAVSSSMPSPNSGWLLTANPNAAGAQVWVQKCLPGTVYKFIARWENKGDPVPAGNAIFKVTVGRYQDWPSAGYSASTATITSLDGSTKVVSLASAGSETEVNNFYWKWWTVAADLKTGDRVEIAYSVRSTSSPTRPNAGYAYTNPSYAHVTTINDVEPFNDRVVSAKPISNMAGYYAVGNYTS